MILTGNMKSTLQVVVLKICVDTDLTENVHNSRKAKKGGNVQNTFAMCVNYVQIGSALAKLADGVDMIESASKMHRRFSRLF